MTQQNINIGSSPNKGDGDPLRTAFDKINDNFSELYARDLNTDAQTLALDGDTLNISSGNSVDLSKYVDSTFSGDYNDLTNKPTIPADVGDLTDTGNLLSAGAADSLTSNDDINITVNNDDSSTYVWNFGQTGDLSLPGGGLLGQVWGDGIDTELTLKSPPGVGDSGYVALSSANEQNYVEVSNIGVVLGVEFGQAGFKKLTFGIDGNLKSADGEPLQILSTGAGGAVSLAWSSSLDSPENIALVIANSPGAQTSGAVDIVVGAIAGPNIWTFDPSGALTIPGDIQSENDISIRINLSDSTTRTWRFGEDGDLTFPDSTVQTTAYPGPQTSLDGDVTGSVFSDGSTLLVDGVSGKIVGDVETARLRTSDTQIALGNDAGTTGQGGFSVAIGTATGSTDQGSFAVALGTNAGQTNQSEFDIAIGANAGQNDQGSFSIAIGSNAGQISQASYAVALGTNAGLDSQGMNTVAIGVNAGQDSQGMNTVAIGVNAGQDSQGSFGIAIGVNAGQLNQGADAIAIGRNAASSNQAANSIVINATNSSVQNTTANTFVVKPIRAAAGTSILQYDASTGEISHTNDIYSDQQISITVAGEDSTSKTWYFGNDGDLSLPGGGLLGQVWGDGIDTELTLKSPPGVGDSGYVALSSANEQNYVEVSNTGVVLAVKFGQAGFKTWTFDIAGDLLLPGKLLLTQGGVQETFQAKADATGVVDHDCALGQIFYHTSPDANWTANFANLSLGTSASTNLVLVVEQGATPYYPSAVQIGGFAQTIKWLGNVTPTPAANKTEIATFTIFNNAGTFTVLGSYSTYG